MSINTWSPETIGSKTWRSVAFSPTLGTGQGMFAAIADAGTATDIATSIDGGATWVPQTTPTAYGANWMTILWDGTRFCVSQYNSNNVMFSSNGVLWTEAYTASGPTPYHAIWVAALGLYVATGMSSGSPALLYSTNFITWSVGAALVNAADVCWSDTLALLVAVGNNSVYTSTNGTSWATGTLTGDAKSIVWSAPLHLFTIAGTFTLGGNAVGIATSPDGFAFTIQPTPNPGTYGLACVVWSDARQLLVALKEGASDGESVDKAIFVSPDGSVWNSITTSTFAGQWLVCANSIDTLVAVADTGTVRVIRSVDIRYDDIPVGQPIRFEATLPGPFIWIFNGGEEAGSVNRNVGRSFKTPGAKLISLEYPGHDVRVQTVTVSPTSHFTRAWPSIDVTTGGAYSDKFNLSLAGPKKLSSDVVVFVANASDASTQKIRAFDSGDGSSFRDLTIPTTDFLDVTIGRMHTFAGCLWFVGCTADLFYLDGSTYTSVEKHTYPGYLLKSLMDTGGQDLWVLASSTNNSRTFILQVNYSTGAMIPHEINILGGISNEVCSLTHVRKTVSGSECLAFTNCSPVLRGGDPYPASTISKVVAIDTFEE